MPTADYQRVYSSEESHLQSLFSACLHLSTHTKTPKPVHTKSHDFNCSTKAHFNSQLP